MAQTLVKREGSVLERILAVKREEAAALARRAAPGELRRAALDAPPARDFLGALRQGGRTPVIAEIKRRSPSRGAIRPGAGAAELARLYEEAGAAACSVLTDGPFFGGALEDVGRARAACGLPVLRKDFTISPAQVYEARAAGADAVLLVAAALEPGLLAELHGLARELGMAALVEVHHEAELPAALAPGPDLVGVNNRDLATLEVDLAASLRLRPLIPAGVAVVAESGIQGPADVRRLLAGGLDAFLVGTSLMAAPDPGAALAALVKAGAA